MQANKQLNSENWPSN